MGFVEFEVN